MSLSPSVSKDNLEMICKQVGRMEGVQYVTVLDHMGNRLGENSQKYVSGVAEIGSYISSSNQVWVNVYNNASSNRYTRSYSGALGTGVDKLVTFTVTTFTRTNWKIYDGSTEVGNAVSQSGSPDEPHDNGMPIFIGVMHNDNRIPLAYV